MFMKCVSDAVATTIRSEANPLHSGWIALPVAATFRRSRLAQGSAAGEEGPLLVKDAVM
jgi:hypothetical protein